MVMCEFVGIQGKKDNFFEHSNALEYRKRLIKKIGVDEVERLDFLADTAKRQNFKWDRFFLIETIVNCRAKCKELAKQKNFKVNGI